MTLAHAQAVLKPADLLIVRTSGFWAGVIRFGEHLQGQPDEQNHVAVMSHWGADGIPWGLEGRPGGVGWVDLRGYLKLDATVNNCGQPGRSMAGRDEVAARAKAMIGTAYDWEAIADDTLRAFRMPELWARNFSGDKAEGAVICSSYAEFLYESRGWDHPLTSDDRDTEPADWTRFIISNDYHVPMSL